MLETKIAALAEAKLLDAGSGAFTGYASLFGVLDTQGDIVVKGAYADTLEQFVERGFIAWSHDWADPVATIREAKEDDKGLYIVADFHSDPRSQEARTRTRERLERGKFVGLSIGFQTVDYEDTDKARLLKKIDLFETSLVTVPALRDAGVTGVKGHGLSFDEHSDQVQVALDEYLERARSGVDLREKEGRPISTARRVRLATSADQCEDVARQIRTMLKETEPPEKTESPHESAGSAVPAPDPALAALFEQSRALLARYAPTAGA